MARVKCPTCNSEFVVPDQLQREPVMCPECGKTAIPVAKDKPAKAASTPKKDKDEDIFEALYQAADYEEKVASDAFGVDAAQERPDIPATPVPPQKTVLKLQDIPEEKPRGKGGLIALIGTVIVLLAVVTYFSLKLMGEKEDVPEIQTAPVTAKPLPGEGEAPWTPAKPEGLAAIALQYAMTPEVGIEINIVGPADDLYRVESIVPTALPSDFRQVNIQNDAGQSLKAEEISAYLQSALVDALRKGLQERDTPSFPVSAATGSGYRVRLSLGLDPRWGVVASPTAPSIPKDMEVPCSAGIIINSVTVIAGNFSKTIVGGAPAPLEQGKFGFKCPPPTDARIQIASTGQSLAVSGNVNYGDVALDSSAREAGAWLAKYVYSPDRDWDLIWVQEKGDVEKTKSAFRALFALVGSRLVVDTLKAHPDRLGDSPRTALLAVMAEESTPANWLQPFTEAPEPYGSAANRALARKDEMIVAKLTLALQAPDPTVVLSNLPALSPLELADLCRHLDGLTLPRPFDVYAALMRRYVIQEGMGDTLICPEIMGLNIKTCSSRQRVADVLRFKLVDISPKRAGPVFQEMLTLPRGWSRLSAIHGILDVDWVDAGEWLRDLHKQLQESQVLGPVAMHEMELIRPNITKIGRYEYKIIGLMNFLARSEFEKADALVADIVSEQPDSNIARRAQKLLDDAKASAKPPPGPAAPR